MFFICTGYINNLKIFILPSYPNCTIITSLLYFGLVTHLPDAMIETEPEQQHGSEEGCLEQRVNKARNPAVHQERQRENRIWEEW